MDAKTTRKYERRAAVIKALAHPSRLYIVDRLAEHAHCVNELTALIGSDMSTVSKHLSVLKNAGGCAGREARGLHLLLPAHFLHPQFFQVR